MGYIEELRALVGHRRLILCGASVVIRNARGELLLQQRRGPTERWSFPGGLMELGESTEETARREVFEETALTLGAMKLIGVYSGAEHLCRAANGGPRTADWKSSTDPKWNGRPAFTLTRSL